MTDFDFWGYDGWLTTPPPDDSIPNPWAWRTCPAGHRIYTNFTDLTRGGCHRCVLEGDPMTEPTPGTVAHYKAHEACQQRINRLTDLLEEIAEIADDRADADCTGDPPRYVPNIWMQILTDIREVLPR